MNAELNPFFDFRWQCGNGRRGIKHAPGRPERTAGTLGDLKGRHIRCRFVEDTHNRIKIEEWNALRCQHPNDVNEAGEPSLISMDCRLKSQTIGCSSTRLEQESQDLLAGYKSVEMFENEMVKAPQPERVAIDAGPPVELLGDPDAGSS